MVLTRPTFSYISCSLKFVIFLSCQDSSFINCWMTPATTKITLWTWILTNIRIAMKICWEKTMSKIWRIWRTFHSPDRWANPMTRTISSRKAASKTSSRILPISINSIKPSTIYSPPSTCSQMPNSSTWSNLSSIGKETSPVNSWNLAELAYFSNNWAPRWKISREFNPTGRYLLKFWRRTTDSTHTTLMRNLYN